MVIIFPRDSYGRGKRLLLNFIFSTFTFARFIIFRLSVPFSLYFYATEGFMFLLYIKRNLPKTYIYQRQNILDVLSRYYNLPNEFTKIIFLK